jgi:uncharacterized protein YukE
MGIKKTLKHLRQLAEVSQQNQETAHNMIWRIERQLSPASPFDAMKEAVQDTALAFGGKPPAPRPRSLYSLVADIHEDANVQGHAHNQMQDKLTTINQRLDFITDAIAELRAEMHGLAKPTKVYASKGTTETLATIEEKVELLADHLSKIDDRLVEGGIISIN